ncbi:hypothetical protein pb186bvf_003783 [Paramecium bursaria]
MNMLDCPICLQTLLHPVTLVCGHSFCEPCLRNKFFSQYHHNCPLCRQPIYISLRLFQVNVLLESLIEEQVQSEAYKNRLEHYRKLQNRQRQTQNIWVTLVRISKQAYNIIQKMIPLYLILMVILLYLSIKQNFLYQRLRTYERKVTEEIIKLASKLKSIDETKDLDFNELVFSKLVKYLFTNCVRF